MLNTFNLNPPPKTAQPNVDPAELEKFSALAHKWWDPQSEFRPLHEINPLRLNWIDQRANLQNKKVLDIGCGGGILSESMAMRGADVTGIDLAEKSLKVAQLHQLESGIQVNYQCASAEDFAQLYPESFDIVVCLEMLEHVPDPASTIKAVATLCKPDGWVFLSTINRNIKSFLLGIVGAEYILKLLPKGTHTYDKFIKPSELTLFCRKNNLTPQEMIGLGYNPLTKTYKLTNDTDVNYLLNCKKI